MNIPSGTCALGEKGCFTDGNGKCYYNRNCENKVVTNADRIRAMSDEELADFLAGIIVKESLLRLKDEGCLLTEIREKVLRHQLFLTVAQFLKEHVKEDNDGTAL